MRAHKKEIDWKLLTKDAVQKANETKKKNAMKKKAKASGSSRSGTGGTDSLRRTHTAGAPAAFPVSRAH
jgi:hypothetical protein